MRCRLWSSRSTDPCSGGRGSRWQGAVAAKGPKTMRRAADERAMRMGSSGRLPPVRWQDNHSTTRLDSPAMAVERLLGAAWTAVHGPSDPTRLVRWLLEQGMHGMVPGPAPRALGWRAIAGAADGLPIAFP